MQSKSGTLNLEDIKRIFKNALIFLAPVLLVELGLFQRGESNPQVYLIAFKVWVIGIATDSLRKLLAGQ